MKMKKGQSLIEYALILSLVTIIAVTALQLLGNRVNTTVQSIDKNIEKASKATDESMDCMLAGGKMVDGVCEQPTDNP